ncbi:MAG: glycosyltransferase [Armatimonadota bacterium]
MITYNHEKFIAQAIESVLTQETDFDYELIIGEDCSTDGTREIVRNYQSRCPDIIHPLLPEHNIGMLPNLVATLHACKGEYVALLEGDDYWTSPSKLQKQVDLMEAAPTCSICWHPMKCFVEGSDVEHDFPVYPPDSLYGVTARDVMTLDDLLVYNFLGTCTVVFRNGFLDEIPSWFYDIGVGDWSVHILNAMHGDIRRVDEIMADHRIHPGGVHGPLSARKKYISGMSDHLKMRNCLPRRYTKQLNRGISAYCHLLSGEYERSGDIRQARRYALAELWVSRGHHGQFAHALEHSLRLSFPFGYDLARACKRIFTHKRDKHY